MCINFVDLNQMIETVRYPMREAPQLVDLWRTATLGSALDMKACYHNIPVDPAS